MALPRVSIGLPVYNGDRYIAETLDSLLAQTFDDIEVIISDNASTDSTEEICRSYARRDERVRYFRNSRNLGAAANYGRALEHSSAEYFRWANCDDLFAPQSVARCVEILDRDASVVLTYPRANLIDDRGDIIGEYEDHLHLVSARPSERFVQVCVGLGLVHVYYGLVRTSVLRKTRLIRRFPGGDIPLVAELALYGRFWEIPEVLFSRRLHSGASSGYTDAQLREFFDPARREWPSLRTCNTLLAHAGSVARAPIGVREKAFLGLFLTKSVIWSRAALGDEVSSAMRHLAGRLRPRGLDKRRANVTSGRAPGGSR